ncbi:MAG: hypothetical protein IJ897_08085 [Prevotella sp.]|nr:hypothetical protein [Prevotella sp.]
MKKIYNIPTVTVVKIQPARILAGSDIPTGNPYGEDDPVLSRRSRFSGWDEEEFE